MSWSGRWTQTKYAKLQLWRTFSLNKTQSLNDALRAVYMEERVGISWPLVEGSKTNPNSCFPTHTDSKNSINCGCNNGIDVLIRGLLTTPEHDRPDHEGLFPASKRRTSKKLRLQSGYCEYKMKALLIKVGFCDAFVWSLNTNEVREVAAMANF